MKEINPDTIKISKEHLFEEETTVFLAGSIEDGKAEQWQKKVVEK